MYYRRIQLGLVILLIITILAIFFSKHAIPDNPLYSVKRIQEKIFLKFTPSDIGKINYLRTLSETRLKELENIVNNEKYNFVQTSALRYSTFVGLITEMIIQYNLTKEVAATRELIMEQKIRLLKLYNKYPKNIDNVEYKYIEDDLNYLDIYLNQLKNIN